MRIAELTILEDDVTPERVQELINRGARIYMPHADHFNPGCIDKEYWLEYDPEYEADTVWFYDGSDPASGWECSLDHIGLLIMEGGPQ